jgi:hypothetical protein
MRSGFEGMYPLRPTKSVLTLPKRLSGEGMFGGRARGDEGGGQGRVGVRDIPNT